MPVGLVAELYGSATRSEDFARLLADHPAARAHILRVPKYVLQADAQDWDLISECVDVARLLQACEGARHAAQEAAAGCAAKGLAGALMASGK